MPWGFNYDWTLVEGRSRPVEALLVEDPARIEADFAAMRSLGANVVRVFLPTAHYLGGPTQVDGAALRRLEWLLAAARRQGVFLILTGLGHIRRDELPAWLLRADDAELRRIERTFWRAVAGVGRSHSAIFAYDLQNEPAIPWTDTDDLVRGCFDMAEGPYCYVHLPFRQIRRQWTAHVHARFADEAALAQHWPDFPRPGESFEALAIPRQRPSDPRHAEYLRFREALLARWAADLVALLRETDPHHLVTVGALLPVPVTDAVDFHSVHLYPRGNPVDPEFLATNARRWRAALAQLPGDKPILVEEFFPGVIGARERSPVEATLRTLLAATRPRAAGWLSFYWGPAASLRPEPREDPARFEARVDTYGELLAWWPRLGATLSAPAGATPAPGARAPDSLPPGPPSRSAGR